MIVFIAGGTGAVGIPTLKKLMEKNHKVFALTRDEKKCALLNSIGAEPVIANIMDKSDLLSCLKKIKPDAVVEMMTALPKTYTPEEMDKKLQFLIDSQFG